MNAKILQYKYHIESYKTDVIKFIIHFLNQDEKLLYPYIYNELKSVKTDILEIDYLENAAKKLDVICSNFLDGFTDINKINTYIWLKKEENKLKLDKYELELMRGSKLKRILKNEKN